jgi:hypothetical protein
MKHEAFGTRLHRRALPSRPLVTDGYAAASAA